MGASIQKTGRNSCFDLLKGISCILILFIHSKFPSPLGDIVQSIARFCVPFFFMVSGYYAYREDGKCRYWAKIKHIGLLILFASSFYFLVALVRDGTGLFAQTITRKKLIKFLVFNEPNYIAGQMWFLFALLYDYIIWAIIDRFHLYKLSDIAFPVVILAYMLLAYGAYFAGYTVNPYYYRNFLFLGYPFFMLGHFLHRRQGALSGCSNTILLTAAIVSTALCPVERVLMGRVFGVQLCSFVQVISLFIFAVRNPALGSGTWFARFGADYSMPVYIFQFFIIYVIDHLYTVWNLKDYTPLLYIRPLLTLTGTIAFSALYLWIRSLFFHNRRHTNAA